MADHIVTTDDSWRFIQPVLDRLASDSKDSAQTLGQAIQGLIRGAGLRSAGLADWVRDGVVNVGPNPAAVTKKAGVNLTYAYTAVKAVYQPYVMSVPAGEITHDPVTTARTDVVVIKSNNSPAGSFNPTFDTVEIVKGSSTATPAIPTRCVPLWSVTFPANATTGPNAVTDLRKFTAPPGGVVRVANMDPSNLTGLPIGQSLWVESIGKVGSVRTGGVAGLDVSQTFPIRLTWGTGVRIGAAKSATLHLLQLDNLTVGQRVIVNAASFIYVESSVVQTVDLDIFSNNSGLSRETPRWEPDRIMPTPGDQDRHLYVRQVSFLATATSAVVGLSVSSGSGGSDVIVMSSEMIAVTYP